MATSFTGEFDHALDAAGRVAIPARLRDAFKGEVKLVRLFEPCVSIFTEEGWHHFEQRLQGLDTFRAGARALDRQLRARALTAEPDRQGRVLIPQRLREAASLEVNQPVTVLGVNDHLELWNPNLWAEEQARWETQLSELAEQLSG